MTSFLNINLRLSKFFFVVSGRHLRYLTIKNIKHSVTVLPKSDSSATLNMQQLYQLTKNNLEGRKAVSSLLIVQMQDLKTITKQKNIFYLKS